MFNKFYDNSSDCQLNDSFSLNQFNENYRISLFCYGDSSFVNQDKEITTNFKSNECQLEKNINSYDIEKSNIDNSLLNYNSFDSIQETFQKNPKFQKINEKFKKNAYIEIADNKFCNKKRRRDKKSIISNENPIIEINEKQKGNEKQKENEERKKRGRKAKENKTIEEHNKMSSDNIIKKVKSILFNNILECTNTIMNMNKKDEKKFYKLDYKYINQLKREEDLKYLNMKLKDIISLDISEKFKYIIRRDGNKLLIEKIINKEEKVQDYNTIIFYLNMTFKEFLDIFTMKKNIYDLKENYYFYENNNVDFDKIQKCIGDVYDSLNEILKTNDEDYFSSFVFHLYNYEQYFITKRIRKSNSD